MRLQGKVVVVTGASMGIGEAIAKVFAEDGAKVVLSSRSREHLEAARARIGVPDRTTAVICDVSDPSQAKALLQTTLDRFGRVDVWVNNAGFGLVDSIQRMDMNACRKMFDTNLFGAIQCTQNVIPVMRQQGSGCIINVSSVAGFIGVPYMAAYGATKHALNCISRATRAELAGTGVRVLNVCPGFVDTQFSTNAIRGTDRKKMRAANQRGISAEQVARATLRGYLGNKKELIVPWFYNLVILTYRIFPSVIENAMRAKMKDLP
ncbi:MAG TPA: SDR family NAD(P)-dependent oxidoreductase [Terriglobales bacterium]|nr:SDR family NAD(P)-dependent oxidoreductase [Terriglobales bacterium]